MASSPPKFFDSKITLKQDDVFYPEFIIFSKTIETVNSINSLYHSGRVGKKGGPSTHAQQDLYRAMLVFACAGLDILLKRLTVTKLPQIISKDQKAKEKFKEFVRRGINKEEKELLNLVAFALIDSSPQDFLVREYVEELTKDSLQATTKITKICESSGLETKMIIGASKLNALNDAFKVRNEIIHEMDINLNAPTSSRGYRTRRQRQAPQMESHTITILELAESIFIQYKEKYSQLTK